MTREKLAEMMFKHDYPAGHSCESVGEYILEQKKILADRILADRILAALAAEKPTADEGLDEGKGDKK